MIIAPAIRVFMPLAFALRRAFERILKRGGVGARVAVLDDEGRILLVRHTYLRYLYMPGGGVKRGETPGEAAIRETFEETGLRIADPEPFAEYVVGENGGRVHVLIARAATGAIRTNGWEISDAAWYRPDDLPTDVSPATRRRIAEITDGRPLSDRW